MSTSATPRKSSIDPSVTTNGWTPRRAMTAPCAEADHDRRARPPAAPPARCRAPGPSSGSWSSPTMMQMIDPTDRSMPPAMITTASPSANSEISEMCRTLLRRLSPSRKARVEQRGDDRQRDHHAQHRQFFLERFHFMRGQLQDVGVGQLVRDASSPRTCAAAEHERPVAQRARSRRPPSSRR